MATPLAEARSARAQARARLAREAGLAARRVSGEGGAPRPELEAARVDRALAALGRARGPARRVLAALAGRMVAVRGWERLGFARLSDYARERLGLMARTVQDLAHVESALARLPALGAALAAGRLTWTQVRLVARVAEPADVGAWIAFAERRSARALALEVRRVDRGTLGELARGGAAADLTGAASQRASAAPPETDEDGAPVDAREPVAIRCSRHVRVLWSSARHHAARIAGEPVPHWQCLESVAAEALAKLGLADGVPDPGADLALDDRPPPPAFALGVGRVGARTARLGDEDAPAAPSGETVGPAAPSAVPPEAANGCATQGSGTNGPDAESPPGPAAGLDPAELPPARGLLPPARGPAELDVAGFPPALARLARGLAELDAFALDARLRAVLGFEQGLESKMAPLLRALSERRLYRALGFGSLAAYVPERLGMSPRRARSLVRIARAAERCPPLRASFAAGRLGWVQADTLAGLVPELQEDAAAAWVAYAERTTVRRLRDDVEDVRCGLAPPEPPPHGRRDAPAPGAASPDPDPGADPGGGTDADAAPVADARADVEPDARQTGAQPTPAGAGDPQADPDGKAAADPDAETERIVIWCPRDVARLFHAALCSVRKHLERQHGRTPSAGEAFGAMLVHARDEWTRPERNGHRSARSVHDRDAWRCTVPGCSSLRNLHEHHVVYRSRGGSHAPSNRTTLCAWHHLRAVHAGTVRCTGTALDGLRFELGVRAAGPPLAVYGPGEVRTDAVS